MTFAALTPREVAELSGTSRHVVEKAIEQRVLRVRKVRNQSDTRYRRRVLPVYAVAYAATVGKLNIRLTTTHKKRLASELAKLGPSEFRQARVELTAAVEVNVGSLVGEIGEIMERADRYLSARDNSIVTDEKIMGGTPVIRGTRMTVYSVLGRIEHGETIEDILADNPDLSREALEAAVTYARTHPLMGRPGGRPWAAVA